MNVNCKILCNDYPKHYIGEIGRKLATHVDEYELATKRHNQFSLASVHEDENGHTFNWEKTTYWDEEARNETVHFQKPSFRPSVLRTPEG